MKKYLFLIILILTVTVYFFVFNEKQNSNKDSTLNKVSKPINKTENKKVDLIDKFLDTNIKVEKNYKIKDNYDKPLDNISKLSDDKKDTNIDVDVNINKETKEFESIKFKLDKNF